MTETMAKKIKALLTKAESTNFPAEAEALAAKAAELMTKYSIDQTMLGSIDGRVGMEVERRSYTVLSPYSMDRMYLVFEVARAMGAYAYYYKQPRDGRKVATNSKDHNTYAVLVGFKPDLDQIEVMLESLNKQMERFRNVELRQVEVYGGMGSKKVWNASFIRGYAAQIGRRLRTTYEEIVKEESGQSESVAIVLRDKKQQLEDYLRENLNLGAASSIRQHSSSGYNSGRTAADRAVIRQGLEK